MTSAPACRYLAVASSRDCWSRATPGAARSSSGVAARRLTGPPSTGCSPVWDACGVGDCRSSAAASAGSFAASTDASVGAFARGTAAAPATRAPAAGAKAVTDVRMTGRWAGAGPPSRRATTSGRCTLVSTGSGGTGTMGVSAGAGVCGATIPSVSRPSFGGATRSRPKAADASGDIRAPSGPPVRKAAAVVSASAESCGCSAPNAAALLVSGSRVGRDSVSWTKGRGFRGFSGSIWLTGISAVAPSTVAVARSTKPLPAVIVSPEGPFPAADWPSTRPWAAEP